MVIRLVTAHCLDYDGQNGSALTGWLYHVSILGDWIIADRLLFILVLCRRIAIRTAEKGGGRGVEAQRYLSIHVFRFLS